MTPGLRRLLLWPWFGAPIPKACRPFRIGWFRVWIGQRGARAPMGRMPSTILQP